MSRYCRRPVLAMLIAVSAFGIGPRTVRAQVVDSSTFATLKADGNGVAALRVVLREGFENATAANALTTIASLARLNLTFDPSLAKLRTRITLAGHDRTAAVALMEIASLASLEVRVSKRGEIVVAELRVEAPPRAAPTRTRSDSAQALVAMRIAASKSPPLAEREAFESSPHVSALMFTAAALRAAPTFVEPDVLRSVQTMPGVAARSDWAAGFNVRGGEADQSEIRLDGFPIYNPFHLGGVFSAFIDPLIGSVEMHTGAMPARFGGRLSGALDVRSAPVTGSELHGNTAISLISTMSTLGRTFADGAGEWSLGARRSYTDIVVNLVSRDRFPYHFQDVHGHISRRLTDGLRLSATGYGASDRMGGSLLDNGNGGWSNRMVGVSVSRRLGAAESSLGSTRDSTIVEQRVSSTRFASGFNFDGYDALATNEISDHRLAGTIDRYRQNSRTSIGYELARQQLSYVATVPYAHFGDLFPLDSLSASVKSIGVFGSHQWRPTASVLVDIGARWESVSDRSGAGFSPRASIKYFLNSRTALTAGAGRYAQWLHSLGREESPIQPMQFWVASDTNRGVSVAKDVVLGVERWISPTRMLRVGAFRKRYSNLRTVNAESDSHVKDDEFFAVAGSSDGVDVLLREIGSGNFSGWLSYTWMRNLRTDTAGLIFAPSQDRKHNLNLVGSWTRGNKTLGLRANVASGAPYTPVLGRFSRDDYLPTFRRWVPRNYATEVINGPRNSARVEMYHRIDVSVSRESRLFGQHSSMYLSIVNLFNVKNAAGYYYSFDAASTRGSFPNLPFVPTVGLTLDY